MKLESILRHVLRYVCCVSLVGYDNALILKVTIDDLIPGSRYKFRIKSENCYGISDPGEESDAFDVAPGER